MVEDNCLAFWVDEAVLSIINLGRIVLRVHSRESAFSIVSESAVVDLSHTVCFTGIAS